jgi:putative endonuclease
MQRSGSKPKSKAKVEAYWSGHRGEALAALFLRFKLYRVLHTRYKTPLGEIDLVAERWGTVVFVEVKARRHLRNEAEALSAVNQQRISRAAQYWLARHPRHADKLMRFDIVFVAPASWPRHLVNAFTL